MFEAEILRHQHPRDPTLLEQRVQHVDGVGLRDTMAFHPFFIFGVGQDGIYRRRRLGAIHFQIAHEKNFLSLDPQENKRVGRREPGGIVQIRIRLARGDDQKIPVIRHSYAPFNFIVPLEK